MKYLIIIFFNKIHILLCKEFYIKDWTSGNACISSLLKIKYSVVIFLKIHIHHVKLDRIQNKWAVMKNNCGAI